jgi:hypothetical protein
LNFKWGISKQHAVLAMISDKNVLPQRIDEWGESIISVEMNNHDNDEELAYAD